MRLTDLDPQFIRFERREEPRQFVRAGAPLVGWTEADLETRIAPVDYSIHVNTLAEADGIMFRCPLCVATSGHFVMCWFEDRVPDDVAPGPGRWRPIGSSYADLSFVPGKRSNSVLLLGGCNWHGFITVGEVT